MFGRTIYLFGRTVCQYDYPVRSHRCTDVLPRALLPPHPVSLTVPVFRRNTGGLRKSRYFSFKL